MVLSGLEGTYAVPLTGPAIYSSWETRPIGSPLSVCGEIDRRDRERKARRERDERARRQVAPALHEGHAEAGDQPNLGPTTIAPTIRIGEFRKIPTAAIRAASTMNHR